MFINLTNARASVRTPESLSVRGSSGLKAHIDWADVMRFLCLIEFTRKGTTRTRAVSAETKRENTIFQCFTSVSVSKTVVPTIITRRILKTRVAQKKNDVEKTCDLARTAHIKKKKKKRRKNREGKTIIIIFVTEKYVVEATHYHNTTHMTCL